MRYQVREIDGRFDFEITGSSFIGNPQDGTVLFLTKKIGNLLENLQGHRHCLVFIDNSILIPEEMRKENCFIKCDDPQITYGRFVEKIVVDEKKKQSNRAYTMTSEGYIIGENVIIGENAHIEPNCLIDHDVRIGKNAEIKYGSVIRNALIGDDFYCAESVVIGAEPYFFAGEPKFRIPSFGGVKIGNNVELGAHVLIEKGFNEQTIIYDNVKIDANVSLGHDDVLGRGVCITSGVTLGGMVNVGDGAYIGMNATIKQRLKIGENARVGMGAVVISNVKERTTVFGNPARRFQIGN